MNGREHRRGALGPGFRLHGEATDAQEFSVSHRGQALRAMLKDLG